MSNAERPVSPEKGRNVEITIHLVRHGEKADDGSLSARGYEEAKAIAPGFGFSDVVKGYTSAAPRVVSTREALEEGTPSKRHMKSRVRPELSISALQTPTAEFSPFFRDVLRKRLQEAHKQPEEIRWQKVHEAEIQTMQEWLAFGENQPDSETTAPKDVAAGVASHILRQIEMAKRLKDGSKVDFSNVTHEFMLAAFIKYAVENGETVLKTKGSIRYLDDLKILVKTNEKGETSIAVEFDGERHALRMDAVHELAAGYRTKAKQA